MENKQPLEGEYSRKAALMTMDGRYLVTGERGEIVQVCSTKI